MDYSDGIQASRTMNNILTENTDDVDVIHKLVTSATVVLLNGACGVCVTLEIVFIYVVIITPFVKYHTLEYEKCTFTKHAS